MCVVCVVCMGECCVWVSVVWVCESVRVYMCSVRYKMMFVLTPVGVVCERGGVWGYVYRVCIWLCLHMVA